MEDQSIMLNLPELLPSIIAISEQAGQSIMAIYNQPERWELQQKADNSPLTAADLAAHHLIEQALQQLTPSIPLLSEESDDVSQRHTWSRLWLVDPLDGTKEFVARTNDFTVNIALIVDNKPVLGVLHAPVYGVTYYAAEGLGAWMIDQDKQLRRLVTAELPIIPRILLSRHHQGHEEAHTLTNITMKFGDYTVLHVGSAFKMCRIAEGAADFYPRFGATMEWDTAAAQILLTEAGGLLVNQHGQPLRYNCRDTLTNDAFFVIGEKKRLDDWLACLKQPSPQPSLSTV